MAHPAVTAAFRARLAANFSECDVVAENANLEPTSLAPFLALEFPYSSSRWVSADEHVETGAVVFVLHLRLGSGAVDGRAMLERVAALFRGVEFADIQCFSPDTPVADDRNEAAGRYRLSMAVPYQFTIEG